MVALSRASVQLQKGMTLVELLITFVILAMLLTMVSTSFMFYSRYWNDTFARFDQSQVYARSLLQVSDVIQAALPFVVKDKEQKYVEYFLGREEGFTLVSSRSLFSDADELVVVRVFREQSTGGDGLLLVYEEAALGRDYLISLDQELNFTHRLVLKRGLQSARFDYYGRPLITDDSGTEDINRWRVEHDAVQLRSMPAQIRLQSDLGALLFDLPGSSGKMFNKHVLGVD